MTSDNEKAAHKFRKEADDFLAGKRKKYPVGLDRPLYVDPKRWPHKLRNGSKVSSLKEPKDSKVHRSQTKEQQKYQRWIEEEIELIWDDMFALYRIDRRGSTPADFWRQMASKLAEERVPAFRITDKPNKWPRLAPGAPPKHSLDKDADFVIRIRNLQADLKKKGLPCSIEAAADAWRQSEPDRWKTNRVKTKGGIMSSRSIASRFGEARDRLEAEHIKGGMSLAALAAFLPGP